MDENCREHFVMSMETIVRPFQTPDYAPARSFFTPGKTGAANVILEFGRGGGGRTFSGSYSYSASFYMTQYINEKAEASFGTAF